MQRRKVLFLAHRIPYPPNKGDKIRSYHLLKHLAARNEVYLGAFVDDPQDWPYRGVLDELCAQVKLIALEPRARKMRSLTGLLTGEALSVPYYRLPEMQQWVDETVRSHGIEHVVVFSSTMAQYVAGPRFRSMVRIADLCDVDSDKWRQYADGKSGPAKLIYAREARRLLDYERVVAGDFDATLFVTEAEAELFRSLAPEAASRVGAFDNGVDIDYFDPRHAGESPYPASTGAQPGSPPRAVFTGAMDYWANVDAVQWFVESVWPRVREATPEAQFYIVGSNPTQQVRDLGNKAGVVVTGRVPDVRPYLAHADVAVAPLRIARGTQNKVLEALAMARPVICTSAAAAGLRIAQDQGFRVEDDPGRFAAAVLSAFGSGSYDAGRRAVRDFYSWDANLEIVDRLLEEAAGRRGALAA